mmetsp:Transcript_24311/g.29677  ORF Transcript_24311/g.29677 Transcript_24311/m.29677 type:complete len:672 (-) Transcript_24311:175-2190(-)
MGQGESSSNGFGLRRVRKANQSGKAGEYPHICMKDFHAPGNGFVCNIGEGSFGKVMAMIKSDTKHCFAIKAMSKAKLLARGEVQNAFNELHMLMRLPHHHFIVNLYYAFQDKQRLYMCSSLMLGGSLQHALSKADGNKLDPNHTLQVSAELVLAVQYLHSNRIVHRDIKPDNILFDHNGHIRLTDFNISITVSEEDELDAVHRDGWGTKGFRAPEIYLRKGKGHVFACDWWSCGAVIYLMLTGKLPYPKRTNDETNLSLVQRMRAEEFNRERLLDKPTISLCESLLRYNPSKRLGCQFGSSSEVLIMTHPYFRDINWDRYETNAFLTQKLSSSNDVDSKVVPSFNESTKDSRATIESSGKKSQPNTKQTGAAPSLEDYVQNFDRGLDQKEVMRMFNKNLGLEELAALGDDGDLDFPDFVTEKEQEQFKDWAFNVDFILEQNAKPKFTLLQTVSSLAPVELKDYVINSTTSKLRGLCQEIKEYRELAMQENYEHTMAEIKNDQLMQKNLELTQEITRYKAKVRKLEHLARKATELENQLKLHAASVEIRKDNVMNNIDNHRDTRSEVLSSISPVRDAHRMQKEKKENARSNDEEKVVEPLNQTKEIGANCQDDGETDTQPSESNTYATGNEYNGEYRKDSLSSNSESDMLNLRNLSSSDDDSDDEVVVLFQP